MMRELRWTVLLPALTLLSIELAWRGPAVTELVVGPGDLHTVLKGEHALADPALAWLGAIESHTQAHWFAAARRLDDASQPSDKPAIFVFGDSFCKWAFSEAELAAEFGNGMVTHKLCLRHTTL